MASKLIWKYYYLLTGHRSCSQHYWSLSRLCGHWTRLGPLGWTGAGLGPPSPLVTSGRRRPASGGKFHGNWQNFCSFSLDIDRESWFSLLFHTFDSSKYKLDGVKITALSCFLFHLAFFVISGPIMQKFSKSPLYLLTF